MSIDCRTRRHRDLATLSREQVFEELLPAAAAANGRTAARGMRYKALPGLSLQVEGRTLTLRESDGELRLEDDGRPADLCAELAADALSELVQDRRTTMGLAMLSRVSITRGDFNDWIGWEPVLRALLDGRPVHEAGAITLRDRSGDPLDTGRSFGLDDDRDEMCHFLEEAGFLHLRWVFRDAEMAAVSRDLLAALERAAPDDGASWWATDAAGRQLPVRVLWFNEQSDMLAGLLRDERLQWLAGLTGDGHRGDKLTAEGLVKPLGIRHGLSDLPWHKDCGQGGHSLLCNALTVGISVTGADAESGALGVVPGSHRANVQTARRDESLDLQPVKLVTQTGDITVHCSDTLHRAHPPTRQPRQVVYTSFRLPLLPGDEAPEANRERDRAARARLTDVQDRIAGADRSAAAP
jgi:hypothetical protein